LCRDDAGRAAISGDRDGDHQRAGQPDYDHRIPLEVEKATPDQGHYLHPELFGYSGEPDVHELHHPRPLKKQHQDNRREP
jgi:hypothetical protein